MNLANSLLSEPAGSTPLIQYAQISNMTHKPSERPSYHMTDMMSSFRQPQPMVI